jgi:hypothetical protein
MTCVTRSLSNITSFPPFESLSVVRQEKDIPMLFSFRTWDSIDKAGIPRQDSDFKVKILQIARYAFDIYRPRKLPSTLNQLCLPSTTRDINNNLNKFYYDNRLKNISYGLGEEYLSWFNQTQFNAIKNNMSLTPSQKKSLFRQMIHTNMRNLVSTYDLDTKYLHYIISNEDWQHYDKVTKLPPIENGLEQIKIFSGVASPTLAQVLSAQKDYVAECFKAAYDAFPNIAGRKFLYFGAYNMEQRATTLKTMLDVVNYINGKYPNVVHGLMMQAHISVPTDLRKMEKLINIARNSGFEVIINEFDCNVFDETIDSQKVNNDGIITKVGVINPVTDADFNRQAEIYSDCVHIFLNQGVCNYQVWAESDNKTWKDKRHYTEINIGTVNAPNWRPVIVGDNIKTHQTKYVIHKSYTALFDENLRPKPCYNEILNLLKNYNKSDYNSRKSIFPPYNVIDLDYTDLASMGG